MASFDFIEHVGKAYGFVWDKKNHLTKYAILPFIAGVLSQFIIIIMKLESAHTLQAIILLPSFLVEGWFLTLAIRMLAFEQTSPMSLSILRQDQTMKASMIIYALTKFILYGLTAFIWGYLDSLESLEQNPFRETSSLLIYFVTMAALAFGIWAFRFVWLFVPTAMGMPIKLFLKKTNSLKMSMLILAGWMVSYIPLFIIFMMFIATLLAPFDSIEDISTSVEIGLQIIMQIMQLTVNVISAAFVAFFVKNLLSGNTSIEA